jgi:hypothetical protein
MPKAFERINKRNEIKKVNLQPVPLIGIDIHRAGHKKL